ncbi:hypothetical protein [Granulicella aggregans]|uniref:hypothetical protein n=1 Tax=Granulicella aggregans TaxID=474949 RepID=UPI0016214A46|nr:hypothetical protein [Granulicella aggregans]
MLKRIYASTMSSLVLLIPAAHCQSVQPRIAAATFALIPALTPSPEQRPSPNVQASKDEAEIQACTLTMGTITRMLQAAQELFLLKPDADDRKDNADDSKAEQSLDQQTAGLAKRPQIVAVLGKYGFTPRTYTVAFYAYLSAREDTVTKAHVNQANIALVRAHKKEIDQLMNKYVYPYW